MKVCTRKHITKEAAGPKRAAVTKKAAGTKRRLSRGCGGRCMKPGPIVRNPYLNFLRKFRKENCGLTPIETIRRGARAWKCLTVSQKLGYIKEAFYAPKRRRNMQCQMVCKKKPPCGKSHRKRIRQKRDHGKRRSHKPKHSPPKPRSRRSNAKTSSKPRPSPSKPRRRSSKPRSKKAGVTC